jgi:hypothetical protein
MALVIPLGELRVLDMLGTAVEYRRALVVSYGECNKSHERAVS